MLNRAALNARAMKRLATTMIDTSSIPIANPNGKKNPKKSSFDRVYRLANIDRIGCLS